MQSSSSFTSAKRARGKIGAAKINAVYSVLMISLLCAFIFPFIALISITQRGFCLTFNYLSQLCDNFHFV